MPNRPIISSQTIIELTCSVIGATVGLVGVAISGDPKLRTGWEIMVIAGGAMGLLSAKILIGFDRVRIRQIHAGKRPIGTGGVVLLVLAGAIMVLILTGVACCILWSS
jgi:hypothetical protein